MTAGCGRIQSNPLARSTCVNSISNRKPARGFLYVAGYQSIPCIQIQTLLKKTKRVREAVPRMATETEKLRASLAETVKFLETLCDWRLQAENDRCYAERHAIEEARKLLAKESADGD